MLSPVQFLPFRIIFVFVRANALENTETIKKSQKSKKSLQKEEKKVCYY